MQLKIAMLSVHSCPLGKLGGENTGGMSVYIRELCREIGKRGHLVDVYTRAHEPLHDPIVALGKNARLIHITAGKEERIDKVSLYPHLAEFAHEVERFRRHCGLHYDLIHSHYWLSGWVGKQIQKWWGVPHVVMFHTLGAVKNAAHIGGAEPQVRIHSEKGVIRDCHRVIAPTAREKENLITYYGASPEAVTVIPCGVNLDLFRSMEKGIARRCLGLDGEKIILFVGRIVPLKGLDKLLMALPYLRNGSRLRILVVGGDDCCHEEMERLKSLAKSLQIQDYVSFLGLVYHEKLPYFYSAADLCVLPSYYESFGLVALESLACGTPVVGTNVGGLENVIRQGETGYVVADNGPSGLASKIARLLSISEKVSKSSIRASVMDFSWSKIAETMVNEYRTVLSDYSVGRP
jgi:D-inositol-3-phosphate glycosyltransferase